MQFFNPKLSTITFSVSMNKGTVQIAMAKTMDPNFTGRPEKGQRMYDWENTVYFSLRPEECIYILENLNSLLKGTYVNHREKNDKFKNILSLTHFRNGQPSRLIIDRSLDGSKNPTGSIIMTILPPQGNGFPVTYALRHDEMRLVSFYLDHGAKNLHFYKDVYEAMERINYAKQKKQGSQDSNQSRSSYSNYNNNQGSQTSSTFDNTSAGEGVEQQNVEEVSDINVGWS